MTQNVEAPSILDELPGELLIWVLIVSELLVFGAGLAVFLAVRLTDPGGFAEAQDHLHRTGAALNTVVLVTSGFLAALALRLREGARRGAARLALVAAAALGVVFLVIKGAEYADKAAQGIAWDTHAFFTFYYLLTGSRRHVAAGVVSCAGGLAGHARQYRDRSCLLAHGRSGLGAAVPGRLPAGIG